MKKILVLFLLITPFSFAENQGSSAGAFLRVGLGARALSMGGAQVAWDNPDGMSFYYNPGMLPMLKNKTASFNYQFMPLDRSISHVGLSLPIKPTGGFSLNWVHAGIKNLSSYSSMGEDLGDLDYGDEAFYVSFAQSFRNKFYVGLSFKFLWEHFGDGTDDFSYKSTGKAFDLGFAAKIHPAITLGAVVRNLGGTMKSNTNEIYEKGMEIEEKLPVYYVTGLKYVTPISNLVIEGDYLVSNMGKKDVLFGMEYSYHDVFIRSGMEDTRVHFGGGFYKKLKKGLVLGLDYAFVPGYFDEGSSHLFSWQFIID